MAMTDNVGPAETRYNQLKPDRQAFIDKAKDCARLTIPALSPEDYRSNRRNTEPPRQGVGAKGVNNLSSKLLMTQFPPNAPFFRHVPDRLAVEMEQEQGGGKDLLSDIEKALSKIEKAVMDEIETSGDRPILAQTLKHLIISGNALFYGAEDGSQVYPLNRYVVERDPKGNLLEIVVHEQIAPAALEPDFLAKLKDRADYKNKKKAKDGQSEILNIFTHIERIDGQWEVYQECMGERIPGTIETYPLDKSPWMALRWTYVQGEDYGRSHVEEYLGDLQTLEGLTKAVVQGAAAASKVLTLVDPNSTTRWYKVAEAENGAVIEGRAEDVTFLTVDKVNDFRTAETSIDRIERRMAHAFLMNASIQRSGERVTAEEIRTMAEDLEAALGGVYTALAQEFQLPYVKNRMRIMERNGRMPALPDEDIKVVVTTGLEALGRGQDRSRLVQFVGTLVEMLGPEALQMFIEMSELIKRLATADGIHPDGLIKDPEAVKAEQRGNQVQGLLTQLPPEMQSAVMGAVGQAASGGQGLPQLG